MRVTYSKQAVTARTGRDLETMLRELYVGRRHTLKEIADALGVNRETVRKWTVEYGISRDERPPVTIGPDPDGSAEPGHGAAA